MFPHHSVPVYDDNEGQTRPIREILSAIVGTSQDEEDPTPWIESPEALLAWMNKAHKAEPIFGILDLHDAQYADLSRFKLPNVGTEGGQLTGWRFAEYVLMPAILKHQIRYSIPLVFVSSRAEALDRAKDEAASSPIAEDFRKAGLGLSFLSKPQHTDGHDARALRRELLRLATDRLEQIGLFSEPLFELGFVESDFDHLVFIVGIQKIWDLSDREMAHILLFEQVRDFAKFREDKLIPTTGHWRRHAELLFSLKSRLSGLKQRAGYEERQAYDRKWLRTPRVDLFGCTPLTILLTGETKFVDMLINYVEGVEVDRRIWKGIAAVAEERLRKTHL
jgi:hypothetical protein